MQRTLSKRVICKKDWYSKRIAEWKDRLTLGAKNRRKVEVESQFDSKKRKEERGVEKEDESEGELRMDQSQRARFYVTGMFPMTMMIEEKNARVDTIQGSLPSQLDDIAVSWLQITFRRNAHPVNSGTIMIHPVHLTLLS